jgi:hypothetical protein
MTNIVRYTIDDATRLDSEMKQLLQIYSAAKIRTGMELAKRLKEVEDNKLYLKLDEQAYPSFPRYMESLGISYKVARDLISLYDCFVLAAGYSVEELSKTPYYKLVQIKPLLFKKEKGEYLAIKTKKEIDSWVSDAKSDLSIEDLKQKRHEDEVGPHEHDFETITFNKCRICKLKEYQGKN